MVHALLMMLMVHEEPMLLRVLPVLRVPRVPRVLQKPRDVFVASAVATG